MRSMTGSISDPSSVVGSSVPGCREKWPDRGIGQSFGTAGTPEALRCPPTASRQPRRLLSSTPFQSLSGECRFNAIGQNPARSGNTPQRRTPMAALLAVSLFLSAVIGLASMSQCFAQNAGGVFGIGGPLGARGGLGPPDSRGGGGNPGGSAVSAGNPGGATTSGAIGPAVIVPGIGVAPPANMGGSARSAGTSAGFPGSSSTAAGSPPEIFAPGGGHPAAYGPKDLSREDAERLDRLEQVMAEVGKQLSSKLRICRGC